jgi:cyclin-dependent kinase 2
LVFELVDYDLKKYMGEHKATMTAYQVKLFLYQLCNGLNYCHARRIIHRDLKPQNLLIDKAGTLKIADFGLARAFSLPIKTLTHEIETLWYRAPEVLLGQKQYSLGVDIWAVGCIFSELMEKKPMFCGDSEIDQIFKIFQFHGTPTPAQWMNVRNNAFTQIIYPTLSPPSLSSRE